MIINFTFHHYSPFFDGIFEADEHCLSKWVDHCEDHPDVDQFYVRSAWKGLTDPQEAGKHSKRQIIGT